MNSQRSGDIDKKLFLWVAKFMISILAFFAIIIYVIYLLFQIEG